MQCVEEQIPKGLKQSTSTVNQCYK